MAEKLWEKGYELDEQIEKFTVGEDYVLDMEIIEYDLEASKAHVEMLQRVGLLSGEETKKLLEALDELKDLVEKGDFTIKPEDEDSHTAIEKFLVKKLGAIGEKIHTARSRNDQILVALRLYYREKLGKVEKEIERLQKAMKEFAENYGHIKFAGFTHTRKAMPTTFRMWTEAFIDALDDDLKLLKFVRNIVDQSPLGSGAGYGVPLDIDREYTAQKLGFTRVQKNPIYVQNSRGKFEYMILHALSQVSYDLNRLASDIIFFSMPDLGYLNLPKELCTGSSMMPHKLNPDPLELVRAYHHKLVSNAFFLVSISSNLISGYHRDLQLTKAPIFESFKVTLEILSVMRHVFKKMTVNVEKAEASINDEVMATQAAYELVKKGVPFREAYRRIAEDLMRRYRTPRS